MVGRLNKVRDIREKIGKDKRGKIGRGKRGEAWKR